MRASRWALGRGSTVRLVGPDAAPSRSLRVDGIHWALGRASLGGPMTPTLSPPESRTPTREELRERINLMEGLEDVIGAFDEVSSLQWEEGQSRTLRIRFFDNKDEPVAYAWPIPQEIVLIGLKAMRDAMNQSLRRADGEVKEAV
jgi:hypothetical protein